MPAVVEMLAKAKAILGYDLLDLCQNGPKEKLDDTAFAQPALFVAGLAAAEKLRAESPGVVEQCSACAGLSLGEYCAMAFAGVITFEEGLKVVAYVAVPFGIELGHLNGKKERVDVSLGWRGIY